MYLERLFLDTMRTAVQSGFQLNIESYTCYCYKHKTIQNLDVHNEHGFKHHETMTVSKCDEERFQVSKDAVRTEDDPAVSPLNLFMTAPRRPEATTRPDNCPISQG